jgi:hypothetical protein
MAKNKNIEKVRRKKGNAVGIIRVCSVVFFFLKKFLKKKIPLNRPCIHTRKKGEKHKKRDEMIKWPNNNNQTQL